MVDTQNPTATVTTTIDPIKVGALTQTVIVTYDESMDDNTEPVITLTGGNWGAQTKVGATGWSQTTVLNDTALATPVPVALRPRTLSVGCCGSSA